MPSEIYTVICSPVHTNQIFQLSSFGPTRKLSQKEGWVKMVDLPKSKFPVSVWVNKHEKWMIISYFEKFQAKLCDETVKIIKILEKRFFRIPLGISLVKLNCLFIRKTIREENYASLNI